jgi:Ca2+-binding RTX toxin-like protein
MTYATINFLRDLTPTQISDAQALIFTPYIDDGLGQFVKPWESTAILDFSNAKPPTALVFSFFAIANTKYDLISGSLTSGSYDDPDMSIIYDNLGNAIEFNRENDDPTSFSDVIFNWVAPYTGTYFFDPSWIKNEQFFSSKLVVRKHIYNIIDADGLLSEGTDVDDYFYGDAKNDDLFGFGGDDFLDGGAGNDWLVGGDGKDALNGGDGDDMMDGEAGNDLLNGGAGNDTMGGGDGKDALNGGDGDDIMAGDTGNDLLNGGAGNDIMEGGAGNDLYYIDSLKDSPFELSNRGIDTIRSSITYALKNGFENLILIGKSEINATGNALNNTLTGNVGINKLIGGAGADKLIGGLSNDILTGGAGKDIFRFEDRSKDTIKDFSVKDDTIQLENSSFTKLAKLGVLNAANFKIGAGAADSNDFIVYNSKTGALFYDDNGNGAGHSTQIAIIGTHLALTNADFVIT